MVRIRDAWANRKLTICARSFKALPQARRSNWWSICARRRGMKARKHDAEDLGQAKFI